VAGQYLAEILSSVRFHGKPRRNFLLNAYRRKAILTDPPHGWEFTWTLWWWSKICTATIADRCNTRGYRTYWLSVQRQFRDSFVPFVPLSSV